MPNNAAARAPTSHQPAPIDRNLLAAQQTLANLDEAVAHLGKVLAVASMSQATVAAGLPPWVPYRLKPNSERDIAGKNPMTPWGGLGLFAAALARADAAFGMAQNAPVHPDLAERRTRSLNAAYTLLTTARLLKQRMQKGHGQPGASETLPLDVTARRGRGDEPQTEVERAMDLANRAHEGVCDKETIPGTGPEAVCYLDSKSRDNLKADAEVAIFRSADAWAAAATGYFSEESARDEFIAGLFSDALSFAVGGVVALAVLRAGKAAAAAEYGTKTTTKFGHLVSDKNVNSLPVAIRALVLTWEQQWLAALQFLDDNELELAVRWMAQRDISYWERQVFATAERYRRDVTWIHARADGEMGTEQGVAYVSNGKGSRRLATFAWHQEVRGAFLGMTPTTSHTKPRFVDWVSPTFSDQACARHEKEHGTIPQVVLFSDIDSEEVRNWATSTEGGHAE